VKVGSKEGMFRYADPADGDDALCSTLSELTDSVIAMGGAYPMQLTLPSGVTEFNRSKASANKVIGAPGGGGGAAAEEDNVNNTNNASSKTITRTVMMEKGRGRVSLFINAVKETDITANSSAVQIAIPESQCPIAHNFTVPMTYRPPQQGRSLVSDDTTSDSSTSVVGEWESYLSDEIVTESLELAQQYKQARDSLKLGSASAGNNANLTRLLGSDFYLHAALLLQRARCLEVNSMFFVQC